MKKFIWYFILILTTIASIALMTVEIYYLFIIVIIAWSIIIGRKIYQERQNRFKDWEIKKYNYNSTSKQEKDKHYKEYKNERKNNKSTK